MKIILDNTGKKYNRDWIFKGISTEFNSNDSIVVSGSNGSGKSTLLKLISGFETPSEGSIHYSEEKKISSDNIYQKVAYTSPYIGVFEDYTIEELLGFYRKFKPMKNDLSLDEFIDTIELNKAKEKTLKQFSSGMKQRVKLGLSILSNSPILLLDEPTSNLDKNAISWYQNLIQNNLENRIVVVASNNQKEESFFCNRSIKIEDYKH